MRSTCLVLLLLTAGASAAEWADRWFFLTRNLREESQVEEIRQLVETAAAHGYNGVCWSGLEGIARFQPEQLDRLERVKAICAANAIEIIPLIYSAGYGGAALGYDRNLAVGVKVTGTRYRVEGRVARQVPPEPVDLPNAGLDAFDGERFPGWRLQDRPGEVVFVDQEVKHAGIASARFENPGGAGLGQHARLMIEIPVEPHRQYRLTCWLRAEEAEPVGTFRLQIYTTGQPARTLVAETTRPATFDWRQQTIEFNSLDQELIRFYCGSWGGQTGRFWLDEVSVAEAPLVNLLRREGCPLVVRGAADGTVYEEGRDFEAVADPRLLDFSDRPAVELALTAGSRIPPDAELLLDYYRAQRVADRQISVCMSAPRLYEHYEQVASRLAELLPSRKFLLSMDEIRQGGTDLADQSRGLSMAEILGDCVTRQQAILRRWHPEATCYIWSDMFDPGHNARADYYLVEGDFTGSVDHLPNDLVIACWDGRRKQESLAFFAGRGFRTLAAAYYDAADLTGSGEWLAALRTTPRATGIMYTTWRNQYGLLGAFGDLVAGRTQP